MHTFAQKPKANQQTTSDKFSKPSRPFFSQSRDVHSIHHLQRTMGNQAVLRLLQDNTEEIQAESASTASACFFNPSPVQVQPKLTISTPGDIYEQEADRVADHVLQMPKNKVQRVCSCRGDRPIHQTEEARGLKALQIEHARSKDANENALSPIVQEVVSAPGQPLAPTIRDFFEPRFGHDFSHVRVHTGEPADESTKSVQAKAFTVGNNIVFGQGYYAPGTAEGRRVLAHELTHVLQQRQQPFGGALLQRLGVCYGDMPTQPGIDPEDPFNCERLVRIEGVTSCTSQCYSYNDNVQICIDGICPGHPDYDPRLHPDYQPEGDEAEILVKYPCYSRRDCTGRQYAKYTHCHNCRNKASGKSLLKPEGCEVC